jgi:hypothetical protein
MQIAGALVFAVATLRKLPINLLHATSLQDWKRQPPVCAILIEHNLD